MLAHHVKRRDETVLQAFERIDVNGDGILSREELEDRSSCTPRVVDEIFARCQKRDDGCIDLNDLRKLVWLDEEIARLRLQLATTDSFMVTVKTLVGHAYEYEVQGKSTATRPSRTRRARRQRMPRLFHPRCLLQRWNRLSFPITPTLSY